MPLSTIIVLTVVSFTAVGLSLQAVTSFKEKRAEFMSFPIAFLVLLPYPCWMFAGVLRDDSTLLLIMFLLGVPNVALSIQYFAYEWPLLKSPRLQPEDKISLGLGLIGSFLIGYFAWQSTTLYAAEIGGMFFTSCLMMYSYLVKIWRVYQGKQNVNGLKWAVLITLAVQYAVMIMYGQQSGNVFLQLGYLVAEVCCISGIVYKLMTDKASADN